MASNDYYYNQGLTIFKPEYEKQKKKITDLSNANLKDAKALIEANTQASIKPLEEKKLTLPQQFQSAFDANEIQHLVNQRQLEERMANLGLTDSGLNRTQETALAVQKMNTVAAYNQRKQAAIKSLDDQINEIIATGNLKKQEATLNSSSALRSDLLNLENNYKANAQTYASDMVKADAEAEAARIKAKQVSLTEDQIDNALNAFIESEDAYNRYLMRLQTLTGYSADIINYYLTPLIVAENLSHIDKGTGDKKIKQQREDYNKLATGSGRYGLKNPVPLELQYKSPYYD